MKKVLLTGGKGMLGRTICRILSDRFSIIPTDLPEADITSPESIASVLRLYSPDAVIHCAAATAVDACEASPERAYRLNARGSANVAAAPPRSMRTSAGLVRMPLPIITWRVSG